MASGLVAVAALTLSALSVAAGTAFGAGAGYAPGGNPTVGGGATGLAGTVITSTAIQPTGGTAAGVLGTTTVTATVPAGAFTGTTQLVITDATTSSLTPPSGTSIVVFGIGFYENGTKVTGSFPAVTVTVSSPSIKAGSTVYFVTGSGLQAVSGAQVSIGSATFSITSDPVIEVASSTTAAPVAVVPGATSAQTGKPVILELGIAGILILAGATLLVGRRLRRRTS